MGDVGIGDAAKSIAAFREIEELLASGDIAGAKARCRRLAATSGIPLHHRWEAQERLREIERREAGKPMRQTAATRTRLSKRPTPGMRLYVAVDGSDASPGTRRRPFATLERARDAIRALKQHRGLPDGGVVVTVAPGEYARRGTFVLTGEDSGAERSPIVYRAASKGAARFTGGIRLRVCPRSFPPEGEVGIIECNPFQECVICELRMRVT